MPFASKMDRKQIVVADPGEWESGTDFRTSSEYLFYKGVVVAQFRQGKCVGFQTDICYIENEADPKNRRNPTCPLFRQAVLGV